MPDNIKVVVKVRPLVDREIDNGLSSHWVTDQESIWPQDNSREPYTFDAVFGETCSTQQVYEEVAKPIVQSALEGINGTIFAYGQTSSGKTYTMVGNNDSPGIIPLAINHIFESIRNDSDRKFLLRVSCLEIYNERVKDLLDIKNTAELKIQEKNGYVQVTNCREVVTETGEEILNHFAKGNQNRCVGETLMNEKSSRSHTIFKVIIESRKHTVPGIEEDDCVISSHLNLVDLAGSERASQTGATKERLREGGHINKSLTNLSRVMRQLCDAQGDPNRFINYRDSKLTHILQSSLGGNAKTGIICAVTPATFEETDSTLKFAMCAKVIANKPIVNAIISDATQLKILTEQLNRLQKEMDSKKNIEEDNQRLQDKVVVLKARIAMGFGDKNDVQQQNLKHRRRTWGGPNLLPSISENECQQDDRKRSNVCELLSFRKPLRFSNISEHEIETFSCRDSMVSTATALDNSDIGLNLSNECSPDHKCFYKMKATPPCVLIARAKTAEKELEELQEMTSLEKILSSDVKELTDNMISLKEKFADTIQEKNNVIELCRSEIKVLKEDLKDQKEKYHEAEKTKVKLSKENDFLNSTNTDFKFEMETMAKNHKRREAELLLLVEEAPKMKVASVKGIDTSIFLEGFVSENGLDVSMKIEQYSELQNKYDALCGQYDMLSFELKEKLELLDNAERTIIFLEEQSAVQKKDRMSFDLTREDMNCEINNLHFSMNKYESQILSLKKENAILAEELDDLRGKFVEAIDTNDESDVTMHDVNMSCDMENAKISSEIINLHAECVSKINAFEESLSRKSEIVHEITKEMDATKLQLSALINENQQLSHANIEQKSHLENVTELFKKQIAETTAQYQTLSKVNDYIESRFNDIIIRNDPNCHLLKQNGADSESLLNKLMQVESLYEELCNNKFVVHSDVDMKSFTEENEINLKHMCDESQLIINSEKFDEKSDLDQKNLPYVDSNIIVDAFDTLLSNLKESSKSFLKNNEIDNRDFYINEMEDEDLNERLNIISASFYDVVKELMQRIKDDSIRIVSLMKDKESIQTELDVVSKEVKELLIDSEELSKKVVGKYRERHIINAEFGLLVSKLASVQHYHNSLHTTCDSTVLYLKQSLVALQCFLQNNFEDGISQLNASYNNILSSSFISSQNVTLCDKIDDSKLSEMCNQSMVDNKILYETEDLMSELEAKDAEIQNLLAKVEDCEDLQRRIAHFEFEYKKNCNLISDYKAKIIQLEADYESEKLNCRDMKSKLELLSDLEHKCKKLEDENDALSTEVMEYVDEIESLKKSSSDQDLLLKEKLRDLELALEKRERDYEKLKQLSNPESEPKKQFNTSVIQDMLSNEEINDLGIIVSDMQNCTFKTVEDEPSKENEVNNLMLLVDEKMNENEKLNQKITNLVMKIQEFETKEVSHIATIQDLLSKEQKIKDLEQLVDQKMVENDMLNQKINNLVIKFQEFETKEASDIATVQNILSKEQKIKDLEQLVDQKVVENEVLDQNINKLVIKIQEFEIKEASHIATIQDMLSKEQKIKDLEQLVDQKMVENDMLNLKINNLVIKIQEFETKEASDFATVQNILSKEQKIKDLEQLVDQKMVENDMLNQKINNLVTKIEEFETKEAKIKDLEGFVYEKKLENDNLNQEVQNLIAKVEEFQSKEQIMNLKIQEISEASKNEILQLTDEVNTRRASEEFKNEQILHLEKIMDEIKAQKAELDEKVVSLTMNIEECSKLELMEVASKTETINSLLKEIEELKGVKEVTNEQIKNLSENVDALNKTLKDKDVQYSKLMLEMTTVLNERDSLLVEVESYKSELLNGSSRLQELQKTIDSYLCTIKELQIKNAEYIECEAVMKKVVDGHEFTIDKLKEEVESKSSELMLNKKELTSELENLRIDFAKTIEYKNLYHELEKQCLLLKDEIETLNECIVRNSDQLKEYRQKEDCIVEVKKNHNEQINKLKQDFNLKQTELLNKLDEKEKEKCTLQNSYLQLGKDLIDLWRTVAYNNKISCDEESLDIFNIMNGIKCEFLEYRNCIQSHDVRVHELSSKIQCEVNASSTMREELEKISKMAKDAHEERAVFLQKLGGTLCGEAHEVFTEEQLLSYAERIKTKYQNLQDMVDKHVDRIKDVQKELHDCKLCNDVLKNEQSTIMLQIKSKEEECNQFSSKIKFLEAQLEESKSKIASSLPTNPNSGGFMEYFVDKMTHDILQNKYEQSQKNIDTLKGKNRELMTEIRRMQHALQNNTVNNLLPSDNKIEIEQLKKRVSELEAQLVVGCKLEKLYKELKSNYDNLDKELKDRELELGKLATEKKNIESKLYRAEFELKGIKIDAEKSKVSPNTSLPLDYIKEIEIYKTKLLNVETEYKALMEKYKELEEECEMCIKSLEDKDDSCRKMYTDKKLLEVRISDLELELKEMKDNSQSQERRKKRQSLHDMNRAHLFSPQNVSSDFSDQNVSFEKLISDKRAKELEIDNRALCKEVRDLKQHVDNFAQKSLKSIGCQVNCEEVSTQKNFGGIQVQNTKVESNNINCGFGSGVVLNQKLCEYMAENKRLMSINGKLKEVCRMRDRRIKELETKESNKENR